MGLIELSSLLILFWSSLTIQFKEIPKHIVFNEHSIEDKNIFKSRLKKLQFGAQKIFSKQVFVTLALFNGKYIYDQHHSLFKEFADLFKRNYGNNTEYQSRFKVFQKSLQRHAAMNQKEIMFNGTARYGINKFSDWTINEFCQLLSQKMSRNNKTVSNKNKIQTATFTTLSPCSFYYQKPPEKKDWTFLTTKVKNQKACGSCWAFVATEQVETYSAINGNKLTDLSPQELVSCADSLGCLGGNTCLALDWMVQTQYPLVTEKEYPYEAKDSSCNYKKLKSGVKVKSVCGCQSLVGRENLMIQVLSQKGPLGVNVDAIFWRDYIGGVIQHHCSNTEMNHAVQLVGYNLNDEPVPYYVLRNKWGKSFGENGYLKVKYGVNMCGVAQEPSFIYV